MEFSNSFFLIMSITACFGYLLVLLQDAFLAAGRPALSRIGWAGYAGALFPLAAIPSAVPYASFITENLAALLWAAVSVFAALLLYSVVVEPARHVKRIRNQTEIRNPKSQAIPCYTEGTYSFSRHPGFIWLTLINVLYTALFFHYKIIICMLVYTAMNFIVIALEDAVFFPKMFSDYHEYKKKTPFLF